MIIKSTLLTMAIPVSVGAARSPVFPGPVTTAAPISISGPVSPPAAAAAAASRVAAALASPLSFPLPGRAVRAVPGKAEAHASSAALPRRDLGVGEEEGGGRVVDVLDEALHISPAVKSAAHRAANFLRRAHWRAVRGRLAPHSPQPASQGDKGQLDLGCTTRNDSHCGAFGVLRTVAFMNQAKPEKKFRAQARAPTRRSTLCERPPGEARRGCRVGWGHGRAQLLRALGRCCAGPSLGGNVALFAE